MSLKLSELDFVVQHRPGSKIGHVDALSRHVGPVMLERSLDRDHSLRTRGRLPYIDVAPSTNTRLLYREL